MNKKNLQMEQKVNKLLFDLKIPPEDEMKSEAHTHDKITQYKYMYV